MTPLFFPSERLMTAAQQTIISAPQGWGKDDNIHMHTNCTINCLISLKDYDSRYVLFPLSGVHEPQRVSDHTHFNLFIYWTRYIFKHTRWHLQQMASTISRATDSFMLMSLLVCKHKYGHCQFRVKFFFNDSHPAKIAAPSLKILWCNSSFSISSERQLCENWKIEDWENVAWSDESRLLLRHSDGRVRIWRKEHESMDPSCLVSKCAPYPLSIV